MAAASVVQTIAKDQPSVLTVPADRTGPANTSWKIPESKWSPMCHPRVKEVSQEVDSYFLQNWDFPNPKAERVFLNAGFSRVTCLYFPLAKDDRIHWACRLLTVLFLIDDLLEDMSFEEGAAYNEKLMPIMRGEVLPDRSIPAEFITYDIWEGMRACDKELADDTMEGTFTFMRAQTDRVRMEITELGHYLEYREKDVGKALLSSLMRFTMGLRLTTDELALMRPLEQNCSKQLSVVNDIYSWAKELKQSRHGHREGSYLCSAVKVLMESTSLDVDATVRILWYMTREWEHIHDEFVARVESQGGCSPAVRDYMKGLEYQMSGNELWSKSTRRYSE